MSLLDNPFRPPAYRCTVCARWFQPKYPLVSCAVMHLPGSCCHYGDEPVKEPDR